MAISEENIKFLSVSNYGKCKTYFPCNFHIPDQIEKQDFQEVKQSRKKRIYGNLVFPWLARIHLSSELG